MYDKAHPQSYRTKQKPQSQAIFPRNFLLPKFPANTGNIISVTANQAESTTSKPQLRLDEANFC